MQQMQQQQMQQQQQRESFNKSSMTFMDKLKTLKNNNTLQEIFLISILFIILSSSFYRDNLTKIPFVSSENNCLNTSGLLLSAILFGVIFVLIKTFFL